ncbi:MAG TPA: MATE family efflux transporter [Dehalococcoidia bacterium]|nr:MATE family efflux transporter [Dehalococcoidia bacterium]
MGLRIPAAPLRHEHDAEIFRLAVPAFGALIAEPLFLLADSAIVGHLGTDQLAGLGVAATIVSSAVSLCVFLAYGTTASVARSLGAGDLAGALRRGVDGLWLALLLGTLLALAGFGSAEPIVGWFGANGDAAGYAVTYLRVSVAGLPAMLGIFAMTGVLRGLQDTKTPLYVAVAANISNAGLNYALVYGLNMGIAGSALGTVLSQWASMLVYVAVVMRGMRLQGVSLAFSMPGVVRSFAASSPLVVRNLALRAVVVGSAAVAARIGAADLAAHQVAFTIWTTLALGLDAVAIAGQALVGRYLGASDVDGARGATRRMIELSILFGAVLGVAIFATRHLLPLLFTNDPEVRSLLAAVLLIVAVMQPVAGIVFALDGVLIGAGDLRYLAAAQALTVLVFVPLAAAVLAFDLGLSGLWWAIGGWVIARFAVLAYRQRSGAWAVAGAER